MSEQFSTLEQGLIERLGRAPQPELRPEVRNLIRVRVLDALDHPPLPAPRPALPRPIVVMVLVAAVLVAGGVLLLLSRQNQAVSSPTMTVLPTVTIPAVVASPVVTASPQATLSPTPIATATVSTIMVVEGPVEHIDGNIITIYGTQVQIDPNDPILSSISIGDVLHVEGNSQQGTTQVVVVNTTVIEVNVDVNVSPASGEVWRDDGNCSNPPPDWAPAHGWRKRCEGKNNENNKDGKHDQDDD